MKSLIIPTVKNLSEVKINTKKVKWKGRNWHIVNSAPTKSTNYSHNSKIKLNLDVFSRVFTNPDKPMEVVETLKPRVIKVKEEKLSYNPVVETKKIKIKKEKVIVEKIVKPKSNNPGGRKGRKPSGIIIKWPKKNFTIKDAAALNKCEPYTINNEINRQKALGKKGIKFEVVKIIPQPTGRGRGTNLFRGIK